MRRLAAAAVVVVALSLCVVLGRADSYAFGKTMLSAEVIELENLTIKATGNASLVSAPSKEPIKIGTMRLESIKAKSIQVDLTRNKDKDLVIKEAVASGGVVIKARRADREGEKNGKPAAVIRDVSATADTARLVQDQEKLLLTGTVVVKVTEPGQSEPVALVTGREVVYYLEQNRIEIKGQPGKQPQITVNSREGGER